MNNHQIVIERSAVDQRQVDGLIQLCKEMAHGNEVEKMALACIPFDPMVVAEAKRIVLTLGK